MDQDQSTGRLFYLEGCPYKKLRGVNYPISSRFNHMIQKKKKKKKTTGPPPAIKMLPCKGKLPTPNYVESLMFE
jgi:hypothetical protein